MDLTSGAFVYTDCYNYIPYIQLSVCEYYLNNIQKAIMYNELAGNYKPEAKIYLKNKEFYNKVLSDENKIYNKD